MFKTLRLSFSLKNTYRVNAILYSLRQIPFVNRIIPENVYQIEGFKTFANIISFLWEIISSFAGKLLYFLTMLFGALSLFELPENKEPELFIHILIFLSVIGALINTYMFTPTKDKYYAMIILGMDAREFTLINYLYSTIKTLLAFGLFGYVFGSYIGLSVLQIILIPFYVAGTKIISDAYSVFYYEKKSTVKNENKLNVFTWICIAVLFACAYGLPFIGIILPSTVSIVVMIIAIVSGLIGVYKILKFRNYRAMYKELLTDALSMQMDKSAQINFQREKNHKNISADTEISSNKKGFEYLNELFIRRHRKILWQSVIKITAVSALIIAALLILLVVRPEVGNAVNGMLMTYLPYFVFIMYLINRGTGFTSALFVNCDHSLLTYSFFKQPKFILKLFQIRLREIIKINLLPAVVIGTGLALLLYASGGTDNPLNYVVLFVSVVCLSIFFSVHYLTLYYLLQPYNAGTELKSGIYRVIMALTYFICYGMIQIEMPTLVFGIMTIVFCVLYCIIASILVYIFAPKTFRIRA